MPVGGKLANRCTLLCNLQSTSIEQTMNVLFHTPSTRPWQLAFTPLRRTVGKAGASVSSRFMATIPAEVENLGLSDASTRCMILEDKHGAHNYHPLPVVLCHGKGACEFNHC